MSVSDRNSAERRKQEQAAAGASESTPPAAVQDPNSISLSKYDDAYLTLPDDSLTSGILGSDAMTTAINSSTLTTTKTVQMESLSNCLVDIQLASFQTLETSPKIPMIITGLAAKNITKSVAHCGYIDGPAHLTNIHQSVIIVSCRQFRLHGSTDLRVYLRCTSRPIIEDCRGIVFVELKDDVVCLSFFPFFFFFFFWLPVLTSVFLYPHNFCYFCVSTYICIRLPIF